MQQENQTGAAVNYQCPGCGAPLAFGIESQQWECHFCNSSFSPEQLNQLDTQQGGADESFAPEPELYSEADTVCYTCPSCGGSVLTDKNTTATFCAYCHSPTVLAGKLQGQNRPAVLIPFKKTKAEAVQALQKLCKGRPFLPEVFRRAAANGEVVGLYVPYWLFGGDYDCLLHGTATRTSTWRDTRYIYTKTDTYRVERGAQIPVRKVPVDGSQRMDDRIMEAMEPYNYTELIPFAMQYLSGHVAESYDVDAQTCGQRYEQRAGAAIQQTMRGMVSGYATVNVRNLQQNCRGRTCEYALLPVWTVMAPYRGKTYSFTMNGQTGKIVGKLPVAWGKVAALFGVITAFVSAAVWLGGFLL